MQPVGRPIISDKHRARFPFERARNALLGLIEDLPADAWCWQPFVGANHVMWIVGHIGVTDNLAIETLTGVKPSDLPPHTGFFAPGSTRVPDASV